MRTAFRINALVVLLGGLALFGGTALAADAPAPTPNATVAAASPLPVSAMPAPPASPEPKIAASAGGPTNALNNLENKVPDSVKEIVKHLDKTTEDVTLDDLNSARQAIAKIEALIEIEKHLAELEKVRQDRDKKTSFAGAIPASALQPPPFAAATSPFPMASAPQGMGMMPGAFQEKSLEVSRIMGRNGRYSAVLKMSDDKTRTVQVGDHLPDGNVVLGITATEVQLGRGVSRQSLHIKNVDTVFGDSL